MEPGQGLELGQQPNNTEIQPTVNSLLQETSGNFWATIRDLQRKVPDLFNPPTRMSFEEQRASLPWPLNQKNAGIYFRSPGGKDYGLQIKWNDENGENVINLGYTYVTEAGIGPASTYTPDQPYYLQDFKDAKKREVYYERFSGDDLATYTNGHFSEYKAGTSPKKIPVKSISAEEWKNTRDSANLEKILASLQQYATSLPEPNTQAIQTS